MMDRKTLDALTALAIAMAVSSCASQHSARFASASRSPAMSDAVGEKIWLTSVKRQAEVKYSEASPVKNLESIVGASWTKISNITDDGIEHADSGLRNDENAQILLTFDGDPSSAKIDDKSSKSPVKISEDGDAEFKIGELSYECRFLSRTPAALICKVDRGVLGEKYEVYQRKSFLQSK
jgi:hypothetical protein